MTSKVCYMFGVTSGQCQVALIHQAPSDCYYLSGFHHDKSVELKRLIKGQEKI